MMPHMCYTVLIMGRRTQAWYEWLTADELRQVELMDEAMERLREELLVLKARREQMMRRAQNRKYVVNGRG
jgi:hypothetical protein